MGYSSNINWLVLSDEQTSKRWQFSLLNDEQMSNWVGVKHLPVKLVSRNFFHQQQRHDVGVSKNSGVSPQIIHFNRVFPYFHHPFWGVNTPIFGGPPMWSLEAWKQSELAVEMSLKLDGSNSDLARFVGISQKFNGIDTKNGHIYIYKGKYTGWWQLKHFLCSSRSLGKMNPFWRAYFSKGLVQPPTSVPSKAHHFGALQPLVFCLVYLFVGFGCPNLAEA